MKNILLSLVLVGTALAQSEYNEPHRPQFHFTPAMNWMNDPNGMVYFKGEYHLFYQYNPFGDKWGHMSWGHAVSKDLTHWEHLPVALPEANNVMIFSGSAVVDWNNTSGLGKDGEPPMIAIYTGHHTDKKRQDQRIAYSTDQGRTWTNYAENPVLDLTMADFRDPKVIWHEPTKQWVMAVSIPMERQVAFFASPDLKKWTELSRFGPAGSLKGIWECPDLFPLDGKWVLIVNVGGGAPAGGSGCQYFVGEFDGKTFTADEKTHPPVDHSLPEGTLIADFENGYGEWKATGDAFGDAPATGGLAGQMAVGGFEGKGFVNTFKDGDKSTGTLTSPEFEITSDVINFKIGGGAIKGETCMNLIVDGKTVRSETGSQSEELRWTFWHVGEFKGKNATLEIVDKATGGWGHVNVDHIMLSDKGAISGDPVVLWADYGSDFYAAVSWSDIPKEDGRRIWLGWMSNWQYANDVPTSPWRSAMTVPRTLGLAETPFGYRLTQTPVKELEAIRERTANFDGGSLAEASLWLKKQGAQLIDAEFVLKGEGDVDLVIASKTGERTIVRIHRNFLFLDRHASGNVGFHKEFAATHAASLRWKDDGTLSVRVLIDTSSVEVFANDGESVITDLILPKAGEYQLSLEGESAVQSIRWSSLKSVWRN